MLKTKEHLPDIYTLMFMMPGIPAVYYGSEFGVLGDKNQGGDDQLRPEFDLEKMKSEGIRDLTAHIKALAEIQKNHPAASQGDYKQVQLTNRQYAFSRSAEGETLLTVINADSNPFTFNLNTSGAKEDLLTGETMELGGRPSRASQAQFSSCKSLESLMQYRRQDPYRKPVGGFFTHFS